MVIKYDWLFIEVLEGGWTLFCACDCDQLALDGIYLHSFINRGSLFLGDGEFERWEFLDDGSG